MSNPELIPSLSLSADRFNDESFIAARTAVPVEIIILDDIEDLEFKSGIRLTDDQRIRMLARSQGASHIIKTEEQVLGGESGYLTQLYLSLGEGESLSFKEICAAFDNAAVTGFYNAQDSTFELSAMSLESIPFMPDDEQSQNILITGVVSRSISELGDKIDTVSSPKTHADRMIVMFQIPVRVMPAVSVIRDQYPPTRIKPPQTHVSTFQVDVISGERLVCHERNMAATNGTTIQKDTSVVVYQQPVELVEQSILPDVDDENTYLSEKELLAHIPLLYPEGKKSLFDALRELNNNLNGGNKLPFHNRTLLLYALRVLKGEVDGKHRFTQSQIYDSFRAFATDQIIAIIESLGNPRTNHRLSTLERCAKRLSKKAMRKSRATLPIPAEQNA